MECYRFLIKTQIFTKLTRKMSNFGKVADPFDGQGQLHRYVEPAVNRQPGFRRGTRRAESTKRNRKQMASTRKYKRSTAAINTMTMKILPRPRHRQHRQQKKDEKNNNHHQRAKPARPSPAGQKQERPKKSQPVQPTKQACQPSNFKWRFNREGSPSSASRLNSNQNFIFFSKANHFSHPDTSATAAQPIFQIFPVT